MKKKVLSIMVCTMLTISMLAGCGSKTTTTTETATETETTTESTTDSAAATDEAKQTSEKQIIGYATSAVNSDFMQSLADAVKEKAAQEGYECQVASADGDANTQIEQIENFITMGVSVIVILPVNPDGLTDVCKKAEEAGVKTVAFTQQIEGATTFVGAASEQEIGQSVAQLGNDWANATFPDAKDKEIKVAVFGYSGTPDSADRSNALKEAAESNPKYDVIYIEPEDNSQGSGQKAAENMFTSNPDIQLVLCYNTAYSLGVNEYVMSTKVVQDLSKFATFGSDNSEQAVAAVESSISDKAVLRGFVSLGDLTSITNDVWTPIKVVLDGGTLDPEYRGELSLITTENVNQ